MKLEVVRDITMFVVIALNGLWFYIKYVLRQNGYEAQWFSGHLGDIANLHSLHAKEQDLSKKRYYLVLLIAFYLGLLAFLAVAVMLFNAWGLLRF